VTIGGNPYNLSYVAGSKTSTLTFAVTVPRGKSVAKDKSVPNPTFRGTNNLPGEVILLPKGADLKDRFGNSVTPIGGKFGQIYTDNGTPDGNRVVVIGTHFEKLKWGKIDSVSKDELNTILNKEQDDFRKPERDVIDRGEADYWKNYKQPVFDSVNNEVELYRVAYRSTIPEQGNRPTVAYGLVAIPKGATGALPLVSYQHGTLVMKESAPSQAFSWDRTSMAPVAFGLPEAAMCVSAYETRLNVAQFAGHGYAVIAADYFGLGNSVENDSFFVKGSAQQATLDMHAAAQKLFSSLNLSTDKLFLNGWSQGGVVTVAFQEALEARGVKIDGVSTAAAPADTEMLVNRMLFNPRPYSTTTTPDAPWVVMIPQLAAFSLGGYGGKPGAALELFGGNYDFARKFYMREFKSIPSYEFKKDVRENMVPVVTIDGDTRPAQPSEFIVRRFGQDPGAYETTIFAGLMRDAGAGKTRLESPMEMYYGTADDGSPESVALIVPTRQQGTFGKKNIEAVPVAAASHRGAVLSATYGQLTWFDKIRKGESTTGVGSPNPVTGVPAAVENLTATPVGTGQVQLEWERSAGANWYDIYVNGQKTITSGTPVWFFDNLDPLTSYTFTVVPRNASGSGPETKVVFGGAEVKWDSDWGRPEAMAVAQDGSIWFVSVNYDKDGAAWVHRVINDNGNWRLREAIAVNKNAMAIAVGPDGVIWVASHPEWQSKDYRGAVQRIVKNSNGMWLREGDPIYTEALFALTVDTDGTAWVTGRPKDGDWGDGVAQHIVQDERGSWGLQRFGDSLSIQLVGTATAATTGHDGAIWVLCGKGDTGDSYVQRIVERNGTWAIDLTLTVDSRAAMHGDLIAGADGSIWVSGRPTVHDFATVQRIVNENGTWFVKGDPLRVNPSESRLTPGMDGSLWVWTEGEFGGDPALQHVVHERGTWFVKGDPVDLPGWRIVATSPDGSLWYGVRGALSQRFTNPAAPTDLKVVSGPHEGMATLSWKAPAATGGTPVTSYTVTARQGATIKTDTNWGDTEFRFTGLDVRKGPVYFTVAANNFVGTSPVATLLMGQDGRVIDTTSLTTGITTDGTWIVGDGFDTLGQTYSWEALGSGKPVPFGNVAFTFGLPNQPHTIIAKGQTIPVPRGDYGTVSLAGASVYYGAQPNLTFTLNYTDGTTGTWTLSVSDWANPLNFPGEQSIALPYYNRNDATKGQQPVNLYGYSQTLEKGKTLASITLPNNPNVRFLDIQRGRSATTTGVVVDGSRFVGGLDGQGNAYSWEALGSGKAIPFGKVAFDVGAPNQPHAIAMASQTIAVPQGNYRTINLAATAVNGPRQDRLFKLLFTDGSTDSWVQSISDWASPQNYAGETKIATMDYRNKGDGTKDSRSVYLYGYSRAIPQGKTLKSITLMQTDARVKILDIKMGS
jgi:hypothetical protein